MAMLLQFRTPATSDEKLAALILYILGQMGPMTWERLCWTLWKIDTESYIRTGKSITGCQYYKASAECEG